MAPDVGAPAVRTVLNVTHGVGLTFNIAERVSVAVSVAAFWIAIRRAATVWQAVLAVVVLVWSRAGDDPPAMGHLLLDSR